MSIYKTTIKAGEEQLVVLAIYHKDESELQQIVESTVVNKLHHILVLDRSGSMYNDIDELIDNVQECIATISDEDIVTIIWFSGAGQHRTIIKGANKTEQLNALLDTLRSTVGCTCFSDPLKEINLILDEIGMLAPVSITLFTDGQPVVPWSSAEEEARCMHELAKMQPRILALNTIGYGNYYNQELMKKFAACSEFGEMFHTSKISDFGSIFSHNFEKVSDAVCESVKISTLGATIIYLNRTFTKMEDGEYHLTRIDKRKNQFFLFADSEFDFEYNGVQMNSATCEVKASMNPAQISNFLFAYAYNLYYSGDRKTSLQILSQLRDKALIDSHMNAFTFRESGEHMKRLSSALLTPAEGRFCDGIAPEGYVPAPDALCVMDVLKALQSGESLFLPYGNNVPRYQRIGKKTTDEFNLFKQTTDEIRVPFESFVDHSKKMNLSILVRINGTVKINPKRAEQVGLASLFASYIWRNFTVIKDGNVNIPQMEVLLTAEDFMNEKINPVIGKFIEHVDIDGQTFSRCVLDLTLVPVINRMYINEATTIKDIFRNIVRMTALEAMQKIVNDKLAQFPETMRKGSGEFALLTEEQIAVLLEHGVQKDGSYSGVEKSRPSADECDSYQARTMEFTLSGFGSWPKLADVLERKAKIDAEAAKGGGKSKFTPAMAALYEAMEKVQTFLDMRGLLREGTESTIVMNELQALQKSIKAELKSIRSDLSTLKIAKLLSGEWFEDLSTDPKGGYFYEEGDTKMVAKAAYVTEYF